MFMKQIDIRFADPITALDLSCRHVCLGSAMGRITFHDIINKKDIVISDSQPEIIRGVSLSFGLTAIVDISLSRWDQSVCLNRRYLLRPDGRGDLQHY